MGYQGVDHYKVLGVESTATAAEVRRAYLQLSRRWHPDKAQQNGITAQEATEKFQAISVANETLSDSSERRRYDISRSQPRRQTARETAGFESSFFNCWFYPRPTQYDWSDFQDFCYAGHAYGASSPPAKPMSAEEVWKAFVSGTLSEYDFKRDMRGCFSGFEGDPNGFYHVFDKLFKKKIFGAEPTDASDPTGASPDFGSSTTAWKSGPGPFYQFWASFRTAQRFSCNVAKSTSGSKQDKRSQAKKQQKAMCDAYDGKVRALLNFLQAVDPRVKAHEKWLEKRAEEQHLENTAKLKAERAERQKTVEAERAARRRREQEESEDDLDSAESDGESGNFGPGVILVVTSDGVVMTCKQAMKRAAQDALGVVEGGEGEALGAHNGGEDTDEAEDADEAEVGSSEDVVESEADVDEAKNGSSEEVVECEVDTGEAEESVDVNSVDESAGSESSESSEPEVYRCEACKKYFHHANQYNAHLASKKHKKEHEAWLKRTKRA